MPEDNLNPAELASVACLNQVYLAMEARRNFLVEAGAGAGKTYTLIKALRKQIDTNGPSFLKVNKKIACITYTNVARDEIKSRTDNHPVIFSETIHAFAWDLIKDFQKIIRSRIPELSEKWKVRVEEGGGLKNQEISYNLGYPKITEYEIFLHHDDVIRLLVFLLNDEKFKKILTNRFPVIFIDEYQDTNKELANSLVTNFIESESGPLIGFFGDHWQKIYGTNSIGLITARADKLTVIGKEANFRSERIIVESLNRIRPELIQHVKNPDSTGEIIVYHSNPWEGNRRSEAHWAGDLPATVAHEYLQRTIQELQRRGWDFDPIHTKILMLTNNILAAEQGYGNILEAIGADDLLKKNNDYVSFLADTVEPGAAAFSEGKYGQMLSAFNLSAPLIKRHSEKEVWDRDVKRLIELRTSGSIGDVIDLLKITKKPELPRKVIDKEKRLADLNLLPETDQDDADKIFLNKTRGIRQAPYSELIRAVQYIDDKTLFSTKHGVKGAEFDNVLIVLGRGWNQYNWEQMLEWVASGIPKGKEDTFERNRNLFYVACSRPKSRLAMLFTQKLSSSALTTLQRWFGNVLVPYSL
jgi:DNA helicase-2/ATP-dependent DNA helicase PcrA